MGGSGLRITGGHARGRVLAAPVPDGVRPTSSRVREALFSLVGHDLTGLTVLDAFGGSGLLGLEAWSRGAQVTIIERMRTVADAARANAAGLKASVRVEVGDGPVAASRLGPFDGVIADPPYADDPRAVVESLAPWARQWLVIEVRTNAARPLPAVAGLRLRTVKNYGGTDLWVYDADTDA